LSVVPPEPGGFEESVPDFAAHLKPAHPQPRPFEDVEQATALVY
jgi:hypothetical protein